MVALRDDNSRLEELWTRFHNIIIQSKNKSASSPSSPFPNLRYAGKTREEIVALANERLKTLPALEIRRYKGAGSTDPMYESIIDFQPNQNYLPNTIPTLTETFPLHQSWPFGEELDEEMKDLAGLFNSNM